MWWGRGHIDEGLGIGNRELIKDTCSLVLRIHLYFVFTCLFVRIKVVLLDSSRSEAAPTYVHVDRIPPRISFSVFLTGPLYGVCTTFPSDAR